MAQLIRFAAACAATLLCQYAAAQQSAPTQASAGSNQETGPAAARTSIKVPLIVPFDLPADTHEVARCEHLKARDTGSFEQQCRRLWEAGIPAGNPLPRLIEVERARERLAALPPPQEPAPQE